MDLNEKKDLEMFLKSVIAKTIKEELSGYKIEKYQNQSNYYETEKNILLKYFNPGENMKNVSFMTNTEILNYLQEKENIKLNFKRLGIALKAEKFRKVRSENKQKYLVEVIKYEK